VVVGRESVIIGREAIHCDEIELTLLKNSKQILIVDDEIFNINAIEIILDCVFNFRTVEETCT